MKYIYLEISKRVLVLRFIYKLFSSVIAPNGGLCSSSLMNIRINRVVPSKKKYIYIKEEKVKKIYFCVRGRRDWTVRVKITSHCLEKKQ